MKQSNAVAHVRQLCCLGLAKEIVLLEFLRAVQAIIPSCNNVYTPVNQFGFPVGAITDVLVPDITEIFVDVFPKFFTPHFIKEINNTLINEKTITNVKQFSGSFFRSDFYNLIWRPCGQHHMLLSLVFVKGDIVGRLFLFRPPSSRTFNHAEQQLFIRLLPYVSHALQAKGMDEDQYIETGQTGLVIMDRQGNLLFQNEEGKHLLALTRDTPVPFDRDPKEVNVMHHLSQMCRNLNAIFQGKEALPPSWRFTNARGRFNFRADWLDSSNKEQAGVVCITIEHEEPLTLKLIRALQRTSLSPTQKEVAMLLAKGATNAEIGQKLHIKLTSVKDHVDKIFIKLDIHKREELLPTLLAIESTILVR